ACSRSPARIGGLFETPPGPPLRVVWPVAGPPTDLSHAASRLGSRGADGEASGGDASMTLSAPHAPTRWAAHAAAIDSLILWRSPWRSSPGRELADLIRALAEKGPGDDLPAKHAAAFRALLDWSEKKPEIKGDIWRAFLIDS